MDSGRRLTLDNTGLKYRPRDYVDTYVPRRPVASKEIIDVKAPVRPAGQPTISELSHKARVFLDQPPAIITKEITPQKVVTQTVTASHAPLRTATKTPEVLQTQQTQIVRPQPTKEEPVPLEILVQSIQGSSSTSSFDKQMIQSKPDTLEGSNGMFKKLNPLGMIKSARSAVVSGFAVVLFLGGMFALFGSFNNNHAVTMQVQALSEKTNAVAENSTTSESSGIGDLTEDEVAEPVVRSYSVAAEYPKYISIDKLGGRDSRVLRMGVAEDGSINTPRSIWDAGWYDGSSLPGSKIGAALILGHVSGPNEGGIFYNLYRLTEGDLITLTMGDDTEYTYKVVGKEEVPAGGINMNNYLVSKDVDKPGLTLMTCAGEFNPTTQQYENRLAVFAIRTN